MTAEHLSYITFLVCGTSNVPMPKRLEVQNHSNTDDYWILPPDLNMKPACVCEPKISPDQAIPSEVSLFPPL